MTRVFLVRHAEAEGNLYRRIQGNFDGQITLRGKLQIEALAERFRHERIDAVYSSDLTRAKTTAGALIKYNDLTVVLDTRLREINLGIWENRTWGDVEYEDPVLSDYFSYEPEKWLVEGAESFAELAKRISGAIFEIASRHDGQTIAIVSHGMAIRSFLCTILNINSAHHDKLPHGDNTCVALLNVENGHAEAVYYNDDSHLSNKLSTFARQTWWKHTAAEGRNNLRYQPLKLPEESDFYSRCYEEAWTGAHGSANGCDGSFYAKRALEHSKLHDMALMKALIWDNFAGIIELDVEKGKARSIGWISFLYVAPEYRGRRFGVQLIGHAVTVFRQLGRKSLRLHAAGTNMRAVSFYKHYGFKIIGREQGSESELYLMEMDI